MPAPLRWAAQLGRQLVEREEARRVEARKKARVYRKHEYALLDSYKEYTASGRRRLDSLEGAMRYLQEECGVELGVMQEALVNVTVIALLQKLFGDELVANLRYIHRRYKIKKLNNTINCTFPRRSGKTEGAAIMIACIVVSQPHGNCIMYNLTGTQAKEFLQTVLKYMRLFQEHEQYGWTLVRQDLRQLVEVRTRKYGTLNSVKSFASGLKGDGKIDWSDCECVAAAAWIGLPRRRRTSALFLFCVLYSTHLYTRTVSCSTDSDKWRDVCLVQTGQSATSCPYSHCSRAQ